jgi:hypothetical protein
LRSFAGPTELIQTGLETGINRDVVDSTAAVPKPPNMSRPHRWTCPEIQAWQAGLPPLLGCNFLPSTAINQLEMFQTGDYDRVTLERELGWAANVGMNTLRVFLHDLLWEHERDGFFRNLDDFLGLCDAHGIRPLLVFFDACHRPEPKPGRQPSPTPGLHNPGWAQSPAVPRLRDRSQWGLLERYVTDVLGRYGRDPRVLAWDLYNEPLNGGFDGITEKATDSLALHQAVWAWARAAGPGQPLTTGVWTGPDPTLPVDEGALSAFDRLMLASQRLSLEYADFVSFHHYGSVEDLQAKVGRLKALGRPVWCTEYMARTADSRFQTHLPVFRRKGVAAFNWGFVSGKSQTIFPWGSPVGAPEPAIWFHDVLRPDGTPFDPEEIRALRAFREG